VITVLAAHGLGLGPWVFDPWRRPFEAAGYRFESLRMPGHGPEGDATFADAVAALEAAVRAAPGPVVLLAHSYSALVAQVVLCRHTVAAAVLVCPLPPGRPVPSRASWPHLPRALATLALGRPYRPSRRAWRALGFSHVPDAAFEAAMREAVPWPPRLCRDLLAAPAVQPASLDTPVLVVLGGDDPVVPPAAGRVVADLFEGVAWRYDGVGHTPMLEPGGERVLADVLAFCAAPVRPRVVESEGFGPDEGIGHTTRRARRGEKARKRSAYGQKAARA